MAQGNTTWLGKLVILVFLAGCFYGAYYFLLQGNTQQSGTLQGVVPSKEQVKIGIAYGTEKRLWLEWAAAEFAKTQAGSQIQVELIPMGSLEGAKAVVAGDQRIHAWSPASSVYKHVFLQDWQIQHGMQAQAIAHEEVLALSPMVLVMWAERYAAFKQTYPELSFTTLADALQAKTGWQWIANKPEWGLFKFGHTRPTTSNSGMLTLALMAYDFANKCRDLSAADTVNPKFQDWLQSFETAVSGLSNSTGKLMREMVLKGPSVYDAVFVYENLAIDYLRSAQGRWGNLQVVYPKQNFWNDNPYYILDVPWSSSAQQDAARVFLDFLLSEPIQQRALEHGFRPGNPMIPIKTPNSPFTQYAQYGLQVDIPVVCEAPQAEVVHNLLAGWQRTQGGLR